MLLSNISNSDLLPLFWQPPTNRCRPALAIYRPQCRPSFDELLKPYFLSIGCNYNDSDLFQLSKPPQQNLDTDDLHLLGLRAANNHWISVINSLNLEPDNLKVTLDEEKRAVTVQGSAKWHNRNGSQMTMRSFHKRFKIPEKVDMHTLRSKMLPNGKIILIADKQNNRDNDFIETSVGTRKEPEKVSSQSNANSSTDRKDLQVTRNEEDTKSAQQHQIDQERDSHEENMEIVTTQDPKNSEEQIQQITDVDQGDYEANIHTTENKGKEMEFPQSIQSVENLLKQPIGTEWPNID